MKIKKTKGFSLVELLIIVGLISIIILGVYTAYKKKNTSANITLQLQYLTSMTEKINSAFFASSDFLLLNNTYAISLNAVPEPLKVNAITIRNLFTGNINLFPAPTPILGNNSYTVQLTNLNTEICSKLVLSDFGTKIPAVSINGNPVKTNGTDFTPANIVAVTSACASTTNNTVEFSTFPFISTTLSAISTLPSIPKASNTIPTVGNVVTSSLGICTGGSVANGSYCACPAGQIWTGKTCTTVNIGPQSCQFGTGWDGTTCAPLPATKPTMMRYGTPPIGVDPTTLAPTIAGAVSSPVAAFAGTRYVQSLPVPSVQELNPQPTQANCAASGGNWDGRVCNYCPKAITTIVKDSNGAIVPLNPAPQNQNSTWDGYRCVTPTTW